MSEMKKSQSSLEEAPRVAPTAHAVKNKPMDKKISDQLNERIGPIFEELNVKEGIVLARVPNSDDVAIYFRGHFYDVASLVTQIHRKFKDKIADEIG